jgi:hypothetical protein
MRRREFITLGAAAAEWKRAKRPTALLHEAGYLLLGVLSLATVTGLYFWLDVSLVAGAERSSDGRPINRNGCRRAGEGNPSSP